MTAARTVALPRATVELAAHAVAALAKVTADMAAAELPRGADPGGMRDAVAWLAGHYEDLGRELREALGWCDEPTPAVPAIRRPMVSPPATFGVPTERDLEDAIAGLKREGLATTTTTGHGPPIVELTPEGAVVVARLFGRPLEARS